MLKALCDDFLRDYSNRSSIGWVRNISRNTQLALFNRFIDIALTYEREQEQLAASEGWSTTVGCVFNCYFCLAGPVSDPAGVGSARDLNEGLQKIAASKSPFHSRADLSTTCRKERQAWSATGHKPWQDEDAMETWYTTSISENPPQALQHADAMGAYILTDRSTLLRQVALGNVTRTTVFFEPADADDFLSSACYAEYNPTQNEEPNEHVQSFLEYMFSERGQGIIANFGNDFAGTPLFAPRGQFFDSDQCLAGGRPLECRWTYNNNKMALRCM